MKAVTIVRKRVKQMQGRKWQGQPHPCDESGPSGSVMCFLCPSTGNRLKGFHDQSNKSLIKSLSHLSMWWSLTDVTWIFLTLFLLAFQTFFNSPWWSHGCLQILTQTHHCCISFFYLFSSLLFAWFWSLDSSYHQTATMSPKLPLFRYIMYWS